MIAKTSHYRFERPPENIAGYNPTRDGGSFSWDRVAAERSVNYFADCLILTSGKTAGNPFRLQPWQADYVATLFGWKRSDGTRRYRESAFFVPRKNGKTETGAGLALYGLCCDGEQQAQVYSAAKNRDQASLVFEPASRMVERAPVLSSLCKVIESKKRITFPKTASYYCAVSADAGSAHGKSPHMVLFDEVHTQPNAKLYEGLKTGMGFRRQPLFVNLSTAGTDRNSICWEVWQQARNVRDGLDCNPHFLPMVYEIAEGESWEDQEVWQRVNPNLNVTVTLEFLQEEYAKAKSSPRYENSFRNLYLNEWTQQAVRWLPMDAWEECGAAVMPVLEGEQCFAGLDLSSTTDISAFVMAFQQADGRVYLIPRFWLPAENVRKRADRDHVPYDVWERNGWLTLTPGNAVDYDVIRRDIQDLASKYWIQSLRIDPWNATQLATQLQGDGLPVEFFRQGYQSLSGPSKELEKFILRRELVHPHNPVLTWMAGNVAVEKDAAENIKPSKARSTERIDGIVAAVMAIAGMVSGAAAQQWYYDNNPVELG